MKRLPRLSRSGVLTPSQWENVARVIEENFREATIQPGIGYTVNNSTGGATLAIKQGIGSASSEQPFPFQCTLIPQTNPDGTPAGNKVAVELNSTLFTSMIPLTPFSGITGLYDPDATTPEMLDLDGPNDTTDYTSPDGPDDYVFLEIKYKATASTPPSIEVDEVSIETNGNGSTIDVSYDPWDDSGDALVARDATTKLQTYARVVLATYEDGQLTQNIRSHLVLRWVCIGGIASLHPLSV